MVKPNPGETFAIDTLGPATLDTPLVLPVMPALQGETEDRMIYRPNLSELKDPASILSFELAGPRAKIFFNPVRTRAAIVTCGGLCPGLNAVIRSIVMELYYKYGVKNIAGVRYGYQGLSVKSDIPFMEILPDNITEIHRQGGTVLGSSRGTPGAAEIVDTLAANNINIIFTVGGDGTMRGTRAIADEVKARGLKIAVVGIPKTIDNDIPFVRRSFGFQTAVEEAEKAITCAHVEAQGVRNGVGIVKLMGRHSGHIAAHAALASGDVNYCWIPEVPIYLEGPGGLFELIEKRFRANKSHAVIVVAEGAGQYYFPDDGAKDASGNKALGDIGVYLKKRLVDHFKSIDMPIQPRYIDPSYMIRSAPPNSNDTLFCTQLAQNAVHAAMSGRTAMLVGYWHGRMTHVPVTALAGQRQDINPAGEIWLNVLHATGQPGQIGSPEHMRRE